MKISLAKRISYIILYEMVETDVNKEIMEQLAELQGEEILIAGAWFLVAGTIITAGGESKQFITHTEAGKEAVVVGNAVEAFGNTIQAIGRTKIYETSPSAARLKSIIGCWLQAGGNVTNSVATQIEINGEEAEGLQLNALGSGVQATGASFEAVGSAEEDPFPRQGLEVTGNSLIALGSAIDAIGNVLLLNELKRAELENRGTEREETGKSEEFMKSDIIASEEGTQELKEKTKKEEQGELLLLIGAWIQVIGSIMELTAVTIVAEYLRDEIHHSMKEMEEEQNNQKSEYQKNYSWYRQMKNRV